MVDHNKGESHPQLGLGQQVGGGQLLSSLTTSHVHLGEEVDRFLGRISGSRAELAPLGVPMRYARRAGLDASPLKMVLSKVGTTIGELLDAIAYDLNLPRPDGEALADTANPPLLAEEELQQQERRQSLEMGLRDVNGVCVLTRLRKVRESIQQTSRDIAHLESLDLSSARPSTCRLHRDALLWCYDMLRQGRRIEKDLEAFILEDQIQGALRRQAGVDPCSHQYLKLLLEIENLEMRKIRLRETLAQEERHLLSKEISLVRQALDSLEPGCEEGREMTARLRELQGESEMLSSS